MAIPFWSKKLIDKFFLFVFVTKSLFYSRKNVQIYFLMYIYCAIDLSVRMSVCLSVMWRVLLLSMSSRTTQCN